MISAEELNISQLQTNVLFDFMNRHLRNSVNQVCSICEQRAVVNMPLSKEFAEVHLRHRGEIVDICRKCAIENLVGGNVPRDLSEGLVDNLNIDYSILGNVIYL